MFTTFTAGKLTASDKDRLEPDSDGLYLIVRKSGRKTWLVRYYTGGKEKKLTLGDYPAVSLQDARRQRDEIKARVKSGMSARDEGAGLTFEKVAREWWRMKKPRLSAHYAKNVEYRLEHYILPAVGGVALTAFKRQTGAAFLHGLAERGTVETARRCGEIVAAVMNYALESGYIEYHALNGITRSIPPADKQPFRHVEDPAQFGRLLAAIDGITSPVTRAALQIAALCFPRAGELLAATWAEIDLDAALWTIPAAHTKRKREHLVPLPRQAVKVLTDLQQFERQEIYTSTRDISRRYVFPAPLGRSALTEAALLKALKTLAAHGGAPLSTIHGFRHTASTLLHSRGENTLHIEKQLAHLDPNRIRAVYNKYEFLDERRVMLQRYADYLDTLKG